MRNGLVARPSSVLVDAAHVACRKSPGRVRYLLQSAHDARFECAKPRSTVHVHRQHRRGNAAGVDAALLRSEARNAAILNSALDCIVTIDHEGCITEFNPAAERTFGYRRQEVLNKPMVDVIVPPSLREQHMQGLARYLATGEARVIGSASR